MRLTNLMVKNLFFSILIFSFLNLNAQKIGESPNFIFILADDQGWNGTSVEMLENNPLSKSDFYETPNIERIAKNGIVFSNAYSSAPVCAPSRYSIQFGQTPARLGMIRVGMNTDHINHNSEITIAKQLKLINPSYRTAHFGKWGMDSKPKVLGYDESDGPTKNVDGVFNYKSNEAQWSNNIDKDPKKIFSITERAMKFIEENKNNSTPFFLQISHYAIHSDIYARKKTFKRFENKKNGNIHSNIGLAAMTYDLDESIGLIMDKIKELGIEENTYIIYSSDNGSVPIIKPRKHYKQSYNHPLKRGKWDAKEGGIRVPFIVLGPRIKPGTYNHTPISFSDLLPTIVDIAGNKKLKQKYLDGGSFKQILFENNNEIKRNFDGIIFHVPYENKIALERAHSAIVVDSLKLIKFYDVDEIQLFDIKNDIGENKNLSQKMKLISKKLEQKLDDYLSKVKAPKWKPGITWKENSLKIIDSFH